MLNVQCSLLKEDFVLYSRDFPAAFAFAQRALAAAAIRARAAADI
jgi:hypothetical protein